jgi:hypothetical protein
MQKQIEALAADLQKVSAELDLRKLGPQTVCLPAPARERIPSSFTRRRERLGEKLLRLNIGQLPLIISAKGRPELGAECSVGSTKAALIAPTLN